MIRFSTFQTVDERVASISFNEISGKGGVWKWFSGISAVFVLDAPTRKDNNQTTTTQLLTSLFVFQTHSSHYTDLSELHI